jgi:outer membrane murein-binding lipoprotein Lpp
MAESASKQATGSWEKLETVFEDRVSRSLRNIGVPTRDDIAALGEQIEELRKSVEAMAGKGKAARQPAAKAAVPARKTAAKAKPEKTSVRAKGNGSKTTRRPTASSARSM